MRHKPLSEIMTRHLVCVPASAIMADVIETLRIHRTSALLVLAADDAPVVQGSVAGIAGILTERDLLRLLQAHVGMDAPVLPHVSNPVVSVPVQMDYRQARRIMQEKNIRHLLVLAGQQPFGLISESDLAHQIDTDYFDTLADVSGMLDPRTGALPPHTPLPDALALMAQHAWSCIVVVGETMQPLGVLTERDVPRFFGANIEQVLLGEAMSRPVHTLPAHASIFEAARAMRDAAIRRMVVVDQEGALLGVITQHSLLTQLQPVQDRLLPLGDSNFSALFSGTGSPLSSLPLIWNIQDWPRFEAMLEKSTDDIFIIDEQYRLSYMSPGLRAQRGESLSRPCYETLHGFSQPCAWCRHHEVLAGHSRQREWSNEDGSRILDIFEVPVHLPDGSRQKLGIMRDITARRRAEAALVHSEQRYHLLLQKSPVGIMYYNAQLHLTFCNERFAEILGLPRDRLVDLDMNRLHDQRPLPALRQALAGQESSYEGEYVSTLNPAHGVWVTLHAAPFADPESGQPGGIAIIEDLTTRYQTEQQLRKLSRAVEHSPVSIVITNLEGCIEYVNPKFTTVTGYSFEEALGQNPRLVQSGETPAEQYRMLWETIGRGEVWEGEFFNRRKDGSLYWERATIAPVSDDSGHISHYVAIKEDISERKKTEAYIHHLAHYDALTSLPNRALLQDRVNKAIAAAHCEQRYLAMLFIDLDHFKHINDSLGHFSGDCILREAARRLRGCVRDMDTVARLGGDEFAVLLPETTPEGAERTARKVIDTMGQVQLIGEHRLNVTASIGISVYPHDAHDFEGLLKSADAAMYKAKEEGRNTCRFFAQEMNTEALERLLLHNSLRRAIDRHDGEHRLTLHYQPQFDLIRQQVIGVEALVRWSHPDIGMVSPLRFIPVAEETGLIHALGAWVMREACHQAMRWRQAGLSLPLIAVNVSPLQLRQPDFEDQVVHALIDSGLPAHCLELELTESALMEDTEGMILKLRRIEQMGVRLAIDDFGTGYSSLSYLKRLPIHKLKIDQSFIRSLTSDTDDLIIVSAIIGLGRSLGLRVIAEGVETPEQIELLHQNGCNEAQGYYFSRPLPAQELGRRLAGPQGFATAPPV